MTVTELEQKIVQNSGSPIFARLAKEYLAAGRVEEAMQLCVAGLQLYPSYATAHLVLAQCYHAEQNSTKALEYLHEARTLLPDSTYLSTLYDEWSTHTSSQTIDQPASVAAEEPASQQDIQASAAEIAEEPAIQAAQEATVEVGPTGLLPSEPDVLPLEDLAILERMEIASSPGTEEVRIGEPGSEDQIETALPSPMEEISEVFAPPAATEELVPSPSVEETQVQEPAAEEFPEIPAPPPVGESRHPEPIAEERVEAPAEPPIETRGVSPATNAALDDEGRIVSKTLAEIYASQGAYAEAILTYQLLKLLRPVQSAEYDQRIKELEPKLQQKTP